MSKKGKELAGETQPVRPILVRITGLDVRPGYCRGGLRLDRTWQPFTVSPEQLATLEADRRVQIRYPQE